MGRIVLSVEDDYPTYFLLEMAFQTVSEDIRLHRAADGEQALEFLLRNRKYADAPAVDLVLLDLNLPKLNGFEILSAVRDDASLNHIPFVVFSSSKLDADRARCLALGAKHFISKPQDLDQFVGAVHTAFQYAK